MEMRELTARELRDAARDYDSVHNEGDDGYNPYRREMERRSREDATAKAQSYAQTPQGRIDALYRRIERECGSIAREWGNAEDIDALQAALYAEIDGIKAEMGTDK